MYHKKKQTWDFRWDFRWTSGDLPVMYSVAPLSIMGRKGRRQKRVTHHDKPAYSRRVQGRAIQSGESAEGWAVGKLRKSCGKAVEKL